MDEAERRERLERLRPGIHLNLGSLSWSDNDIARLRAAFKVRFDEDIPRTETLMYVASEGIRIYLEQNNA